MYKKTGALTVFGCVLFDVCGFSLVSAGEGGKAEASGSDQEAVGGQPEAPGGVPELCCQAQKVHRVGLQHYRPQLNKSPLSVTTRTNASTNLCFQHANTSTQTVEHFLIWVVGGQLRNSTYFWTKKRILASYLSMKDVLSCAPLEGLGKLLVQIVPSHCFTLLCLYKLPWFGACQAFPSPLFQFPGLGTMVIPCRSHRPGTKKVKRSVSRLHLLTVLWEEIVFVF